MNLEAPKLQRASAAKHPRENHYRREVALATEALSILAWRRGDAKRGEELGVEAEAMLGKLESEFPRNEQCIWYASRCRRYLGARLLNSSRGMQAADLILLGNRGVEKLRADYPRNLQYLETAVNSAESVGVAELRMGDAAGASAAYRNGIELFQKLKAASPERARSSQSTAIKLHWLLAGRLFTDLRFGNAIETLLAIPNSAAVRSR